MSRSGPPFRSVDSALYWSFRVVAVDIVKISSIYRRRFPDPDKPELNVWERHGQAGAILGMAERTLDPHQLTYVLARYGRHDQSRGEMVAHMIAGAGTGVHQRRPYEKVWLCHVGAAVGLRSIAKDLQAGSNWRHAQDFKGRTLDRLQALHNAVNAKLEPELSEAGLLQYGEVVA